MPELGKGIWRTLLALALVLALASCDGGGSAGERADATAGEAAAEDADGDDAGTEEEGGETTEEEGDAGDGGGDANAQFNLIASPDNADCNYVPNGHLSGADLLNVNFFFLIIGGNPGDVDAMTVSGTSDTGLSTSYSAGPHNQAVSVAQFALRAGDFGRTHTLTITVDAADELPETDESDNRIRVTVSLPSPRPSSTIDPLACSVSQG